MDKSISDIFSPYEDEDPNEKEINNLVESDNKEVGKDVLEEEDSPSSEEQFLDPELQKEQEFSNSQETQNDIIQEFGSIKSLIIELSAQFESKLKYDKNKEEIIDKLHKENQVLKNDLYKKFVMPFINEIIMMIDDYSMLYKKHLEDGIENIDKSKLLKQFGGISEDLEDILYKNGIDSYINDDERFNPSKQKVIKTIDTEDPTQNKVIYERIKKGFVMGDKIIRMEHVSCYKYNENNDN